MYRIIVMIHESLLVGMIETNSQYSHMLQKFALNTMSRSPKVLFNLEPIAKLAVHKFRSSTG